MKVFRFPGLPFFQSKRTEVDGGDDDFYATSLDFNLIEGGSGFDYVSVNQTQLANGLYSIDLTGFNERQIITPLGGSDPAWSPLMH